MKRDKTIVMKLIRFALPFLLLFVFVHTSFAQKQKQMTPSETQDLYNQIKQTNEFKLLRKKADSINRARPEDTPQDVDTKITKQDSNAPDDDIFKAVFARSIMGLSMESYNVVYDRKKRQILSIQKQQGRFQVD